jgi:hypothetical protein
MTEQVNQKESEDMMGTIHGIFDDINNNQKREKPVDDGSSFDMLSDDVSTYIGELDNKGVAIETKTKEQVDLDDFDKIIGSEEKIEKEKEVEETEKTEKTEEVKEIEDEDIEDEIIPAKKEVSIDETGNIQWLLESPVHSYDRFYESKRELIHDFTPGGQLPFKQWEEELSNANVNINSEIFNNVYYIQQMEIVQQLMQRVKNIQLKCNNQYFLWDRFVELLRGCLARVEYLKPSLRQDGLIHEHMRDVELYFCKLTGLYESSKGAMKTLERAFEALSRKATITMMNKSGDKYIHQNQDSSEEKEDLTDYDSLPSHRQEVKPYKKSGEYMEWDEIG